MKRENTKNNTAVSPVIGVILMVAITVILAAVIGTFVLGLGENVSSSPSAGIEVDQSPGEVQIRIIDAGNAEGLQIVDPDGTRSNVVGSDDALEAGVTVTIQSPAGVRSEVSGGTPANDFEPNIIVPNRENPDPLKYLCVNSTGATGGPACGFGLDKTNMDISGTNFKETPPGITDLQGAGKTNFNYDKFTAHLACRIDHSGFTFNAGGGEDVRVPEELSIPCHGPTFSQKGSGTGTTFERPSGTVESTPILLKEGEYKLIGIDGSGEQSVIQTVTVEEETVGG